jgi:protease-4
MARINRHKNAQGFYRPEAYLGLWSILPDSLSHYLAVVGALDLPAMAAAAAEKDKEKGDASPSTPLPTQKPDIGKKKTEKKASIDEKQKRHDEMAKDINDHEKDLAAKKDKHSEDDKDAIDKSEESLAEKKKNHSALKDEIDKDKKDLEDLEEQEEADEEAQARAALEFRGQAEDGGDSFEAYDLHGDTAIITLSGPMTKYPTSFQSVIGGASTVQVQYAIRLANKDPEVARIALRLDSPGGTCAGTFALMEEVKNSAKPLWAYGEDMMCSCAYFTACGADKIFCNATAMVGSVGTLVMLRDTSGAYSMAGIKMVLIGSGKHKGAGMEGTEITDEQKAYFQSRVDDINSQFVGAVKDARKLNDKQLAEVAEAGVYVGAKAASAGLIDGVLGWEEFLAKFEAETNPQALAAAAEQAKTAKIVMAAWADARILLAEMVKAVGSVDFAVTMFTQGKTLDQAKVLRAEQINAAESLRLKTGISASDGQGPLNLGSTIDATENQFIQKVAAYKAEHKCDQRAAMSAVIKSDPELHEAWMQAVQAKSAKAAQSSAANSRPSA